MGMGWNENTVIGILSWEWEGLGSKKSFPHIFSMYLLYKGLYTGL